MGIAWVGVSVADSSVLFYLHEAIRAKVEQSQSDQNRQDELDNFKHSSPFNSAMDLTPKANRAESNLSTNPVMKVEQHKSLGDRQN